MPQKRSINQSIEFLIQQKEIKITYLIRKYEINDQMILFIEKREKRESVKDREIKDDDCEKEGRTANRKKKKKMRGRMNERGRRLI